MPTGSRKAPSRAHVRSLFCSLQLYLPLAATLRRHRCRQDRVAFVVRHTVIWPSLRRLPPDQFLSYASPTQIPCHKSGLLAASLPHLVRHGHSIGFVDVTLDGSTLGRRFCGHEHDFCITSSRPYSLLPLRAHCRHSEGPASSVQFVFYLPATDILQSNPSRPSPHSIKAKYRAPSNTKIKTWHRPLTAF